MTPDHSFTLIVSSVGIGGTLGGIVVGHFLTRSWQQKQWLLDNRRQEYRELLSAITSAYMAIVHVDELKASGKYTQPDLGLESERAQIDAYRTLRDRILIADELSLANT